MVEVVLALEGRSLLEDQTGATLLEPGAAAILLPGTRHRFATPIKPPDKAPASTVRVVCAPQEDARWYLPPALMGQIRPHPATRECVAVLTAPDDALARAVHQLPASAAKHTDVALLRFWGAVGQMLAQLLETPRAPEPDRVGLVDAVCSWVDAHLDEDVGLDAMARRWNVSRSTLTRAFRRELGMGLVEYTMSRRLEQAATLLTSSHDATVLQIAQQSGFGSPAYFHRRFKTAYGMTPAAFRHAFGGAQPEVAAG